MGRNGRNSDAAGHAEHVAEIGAGAHHDVFHDVAEGAPAFQHPGVQHVQILFQQDHVGRVLGHVHGAVDRDADIRGMQRGRIVDAVAQIADHVAAPLEREDDAVLLRRRHAAEQVHLLPPGPAAPGRPSAGSRSPVSTPGPACRVGADVLGHQLIVAGDDLDRDAARGEVGQAAALALSLGGSRKAAKPAKTRSASSPTTAWGWSSGTGRRGEPSTRKPSSLRRSNTAYDAGPGGRRPGARRRADPLAGRRTAAECLRAPLSPPAAWSRPVLQQDRHPPPLEVEGHLVDLPPGAQVDLLVRQDGVVQRTLQPGLEKAVEIGQLQDPLAFLPAASRWRRAGSGPRSGCRSCRCRARPCCRGSGWRPGA